MNAAPKYDRPGPSEYAAFYHGYVAGVPEGDLLAILQQQGAETGALIAGMPAAKGDFAYAPGKWSVKEVLGHIADAERVFGYRALRFARGDATPLPGFDEQAWVPQSGAGDRSLAELAAELAAVRAATLALLGGLPAAGATRLGTANNNQISVRALGWIIAGHELHHRKLLIERYGVTPVSQ